MDIETPTQVFRVFDRPEYANDFVQRGRIRLGRLDGYKLTEDKNRKDISEGFGRGLVQGEKLVVDTTNQTVTSLPGIESLGIDGGARYKYVLCFHAPTNGLIQSVSKKFGSHVAVVTDTNALIDRMNDKLKTDPELSRLGFTLEHGQVLYSKDLELPGDMSMEEKTRLGWLQKPVEYEHEQEYRMCLQTPLELEEEHLTVELGDLTDIARVVYRPRGAH